MPGNSVAVGLAPADGNEAPRAPWLLRNRAGLWAARLAILAAFLGLWQALSGSVLPTFWFSSPVAIAQTLWVWLLDGTLWDNLKATLFAMALGYAIGCVLGIASGFLLGLAPTLQQVVAPFFSGLYALPKVALAPLFVIMLGIGIESKVALVAVSVFFLLLYSTLDGVRDVDRDLIAMLRLMGASTREIALKVLVPGTMRWIFSGMRIAVRYALTAAILGEVIAANRGVGYLIEANAGAFNSTGVFAAVLLLVVCSVALMEALTRIEKSKTA